MATNITWDNGISHSEREAQLGIKGVTIWMTGLSASGKSTIAGLLEKQLIEKYKIPSYRLDGDNIRFGLNKDLGFSPQDREENIRRIGEVTKLFNDAGLVTIASFISPYIKDRELVRSLHSQSNLRFVEVFVDVSLSVAEARDPKGLYKKAREGLIKEFTGISAPYEPPESPELHLNNSDLSANDATKEIIDYLFSNQILVDQEQL